MTSDEEFRMKAMIQGNWFLEGITRDGEYEEWDVEEELTYWEFKPQGVFIISGIPTKSVTIFIKPLY